MQLCCHLVGSWSLILCKNTALIQSQNNDCRGLTLSKLTKFYERVSHFINKMTSSSPESISMLISSSTFYFPPPSMESSLMLTSDKITPSNRFSVFHRNTYQNYIPTLINNGTDQIHVSDGFADSHHNYIMQLYSFNTNKVSLKARL